MAWGDGRPGSHHRRHRLSRRQPQRLGGLALKVLLDTHIWIWSLLSPSSLSQPVREVLEDPRTEIWLSPISVWEFLILAEKGRLELDIEPSAWLSEALAKVPLKEASLNFAIAEQSRRLDLAVEDPADRFIAATAQVMELTLVTADRRLVEASDLRILPNG